MHRLQVLRWFVYCARNPYYIYFLKGYFSRIRSHLSSNQRAVRRNELKKNNTEPCSAVGGFQSNILNFFLFEKLKIMKLKKVRR